MSEKARCIVCGEEDLLDPDLGMHQGTGEVKFREDMRNQMYHSDGVCASVCKKHDKDKTVAALRLMGDTLVRKGE